MAGRMAIRVVVTGVGVVSPIGIGNDRCWDSLVSNRTGIDFLQTMPTDGLPSAFGAEVRDFDPVDFLRHKKFAKAMCRDIQLGVASSNLAVKDAGVVPGVVDPDRFGVVFGAGRMTCHPAELAAAVEACLGLFTDFKFRQSVKRCPPKAVGRPIRPFYRPCPVVEFGRVSRP